jgi:bacterial/archaeal transporter family-2 protein
MDTLAIPVLLFVGGLLTVQAGANVQLAAALRSPAAGSALQLGIGAALLLAVAAIAGALGAFDRLGDAEPWHLTGGVASAGYVSAGIVLFPRLGAVLAVGLFIAGQMLASLALDAAGALGVAHEPLTAMSVVGSAAVVAGVALIVRAQGAAAPAGGLRREAPWLALGMLAGAVLPVQGAVNAQLRADLDAPLAAAAWSFVVATAAMGLVLVVLLRAGVVSRPVAVGLVRVPWWGWLGGAVGATYVTSVFLLIPEIGVAPTVALTVGGQQIASVFVDRHGLLRLPRRPVTAARLLGVAVLLAGVALVEGG